MKNIGPNELIWPCGCTIDNRGGCLPCKNHENNPDWVEKLMDLAERWAEATDTDP